MWHEQIIVNNSLLNNSLFKLILYFEKRAKLLRMIQLLKLSSKSQAGTIWEMAPRCHDNFLTPIFYDLPNKLSCSFDPPFFWLKNDMGSKINNVGISKSVQKCYIFQFSLFILFICFFETCHMGSNDGFKLKQFIFIGFYIHSISGQKIPKSSKVAQELSTMTLIVLPLNAVN